MADKPQVTIDPGDLSDLRLVLSGIKNGFPAVVTRAINKTLTGVITDAAKEITQDLNLTQTRVKKDMWAVKASYQKLTGAVYAMGKPVNLAAFLNTTYSLSRGLGVKVKKSDQKVFLKHAFIVNVPTKNGDSSKIAVQRQYHITGGTKPFKPSVPYARLPKEKRFPLDTLTGPRIEDEFAKPNVLKRVQDGADARFVANLKSELNYELIKYSRKL